LVAKRGPHPGPLALVAQHAKTLGRPQAGDESTCPTSRPKGERPDQTSLPEGERPDETRARIAFECADSGRRRL